ncbi:GntR family transcriptional regulator [Paenibacillus protaetiae]|uniref:GntR family transcriptional regulator n=1 Tax=Paenibacillus protaetiae TaxID=2509456 RepID=A0A4P6EVN4_9BACL|nr:GntR family transcriptional regulator [Paenibacillus protaetiae]QAY66716.1 GntR family transcriptional regulator [Paenibacillus protaetiae]
MDLTKKIQPVSTRDVVYHSIREQILRLELLPGTGLSEKEISVQFNVSRTPVRESFVRLSQEGLLEVYPQRGTFVSLIDTELVEEARFMREQLERAVIRLACASFPASRLADLKANLLLQKAGIEELDHNRMFELDEAYHRTLFEGCNKSNTWAVLGQINAHLNRSRMLRLTTDHHWEHLYEQHTQMVQAIENQDAARADQLMSEHMSLSIHDQQLLKEKYPAYFK